MKFIKWLSPGLGIKRWLFLGIIGLLIFLCGIVFIIPINSIDYIYNLLLSLVNINIKLPYYIDFIIGIILVLISLLILNHAGQEIVVNLNQEGITNRDFVSTLYKRNQLQKGPKVVAIGGGTGLSNLLRGLKEYTSNITAIVTVADNGGSSGKLRNELDILPPGDIRNCIVALADQEPLMEDLFQYRFYKQGDLQGHSFGNLFIAAMTEVLGDFEEAVEESSKVLAIRGKVLPSTNEKVNLGAVYKDGSEMLGESEIPNDKKDIKGVYLKPGSVKINNRAKKALLEADYILVGPGSLYTSLLPNLLIEGMVDSIKKSQAKKIFITNVMTQPGETTGFSAYDHLKAVYDHIEDQIFDFTIVNKNKSIQKLLNKYAQEGAYPVENDIKNLQKLNIKVLEDNLIQTGDFIRHNPQKLAELIIDL